MQFVRGTEEERLKSGNLLQQLKETREAKHYEFCHSKDLVNNKEEEARYWGQSENNIEDTLPVEKEKPDEQDNNDKVPWTKGTILVMGNSTLNGVQEELGPTI